MSTSVDHSMVRQRAALDLWLYAITLALTLFGVVMVYSATIAMVGDGLDASLVHLFRHGSFVATGFVAMFLISRIQSIFFNVLTACCYWDVWVHCC